MSPTLLTETIEPLVGYIKKYGQTPEAYLLNVFKSHDVVLLAEEHAIRHNLELAHRMIPLLYQAGVYAFGMEFGASEDQAELDQLVTGSTYDEDAARQIMFHYNTGWAYQEYLEIYRTTWALNRSLPESARKFRILNLSYQYNWAEAPVVRTPANAQKIYHRGPVDAYRSVIVRREILDKNEKILILTGTPHAFTRYRIPLFDFNAPDFVRFEERNLGQLLYQHAPEKVFCVLLHQPFDSLREGGARKVYPARGVVDQVMAKFPSLAVGFDLVGSPFGNLPDDSYYASGYQDFQLAQLADGYIYLQPFAAYQGCTLDEAFLTQTNWPEAQRQFPDPDWHRRPQTLSEYWQQIRSYVDIQQRLAGLEQPLDWPEESGDTHFPG